MNKFLVILLFIGLSSYAGDAKTKIKSKPRLPASTCPSCDKIDKEETLLLGDIKFFESKQSKEEKYAARTILLGHLGDAVELLNSVLSAEPPTPETLEKIVILLIKVGMDDYEHYLLSGINDNLKPHKDAVKADADALLKKETINQKEYNSFIETWSTILEHG